ncbi:MAG0920 family protein [Mycoplasmopsis adleri]|uniref:MAG0920 family protein n=1 Tax=Mycoplasmopsis adleri TaxID=51362 RepID=UPI00387347CE
MKETVYAFIAYSIFLLPLFIAFFYGFNIPELINKSKVSRTYFLENKIRVKQSFFRMIVKKIFNVQITFLTFLIVLFALFITSLFFSINIILDSNANYNDKMFCIITTFFALLVPGSLYIYGILITNKVKKGLQQWMVENATFHHYTCKTDKLDKSNYFTKKTKLIFFDPESNNKGMEFNNKRLLRAIDKKAKNLPEIMYYSIILAYDTTTLNNLFYTYDDLYSEYIEFSKAHNIEIIKED